MRPKELESAAKAFIEKADEIKSEFSWFRYSMQEKLDDTIFTIRYFSKDFWIDLYNNYKRDELMRDTILFFNPTIAKNWDPAADLSKVFLQVPISAPADLTLLHPIIIDFLKITPDSSLAIKIRRDTQASKDTISLVAGSREAGFQIGKSTISSAKLDLFCHKKLEVEGSPAAELVSIPLGLGTIPPYFRFIRSSEYPDFQVQPLDHSSYKLLTNREMPPEEAAFARKFENLPDSQAIKAARSLLIFTQQTFSINY